MLDPDRQIAQASAGGVVDSIGDSCRDADYGDFARPLDGALREPPSRPPVVWAFAIYCTLSRVMVNSLLKEQSVAHIRFNQMRYIDATSVKAKLLDDGIVDTLASVGATSAFTLPFPSTPRTGANPCAQHIAIQLFENLSTNARDARQRDRPQQYEWPVNIKGLQNVKERAVILSEGRSPPVSPQTDTKV